MRKWQEKWPRATASDLGSISSLATHLLSEINHFAAQASVSSSVDKGLDQACSLRPREWELLETSLVGVCKGSITPPMEAAASPPACT